jgi:hypothetical protein
MQELKLEDVERLIGRIILSNYKMEEQYNAQIEMMQQQLQSMQPKQESPLAGSVGG